MTMTDAERAAFEEWYAAWQMPLESDWFKRDPSDPDFYYHLHTAMAWATWQARAHYTSQARPPREPTPAMFIAGTKALAEADGSFARHVWQAMYDAAPASAPAPAASNHKRDCRILSTERLDPGQRYCDCGYEAQMPRTYVAAEAGSGAAPDAEVDTLATYAASANEKCNKAWLVHIARSCASALTALRARVAELEWELAELEDAKRDAILSVSNALSGLIERDALAAQVERLTRDAALQQAVERAARELPEGYTIMVEIEPGAASVRLTGGDRWPSFGVAIVTMNIFRADSDDRLTAEINGATDAALAQSPDAAGAGEG